MKGSILGALLALVSPTAAAVAQQSALGLVAQSGRLTTPEGGTALSSWLGLGGGIEHSRWLLDAHASVGTVGSGVAGHDFDGRARASLPIVGRLALFGELRGRDESLLGERTRSFGSDLRLGWTARDGGLFLAADGGRDAASVPWGRGSYGLGFGAWRSFRDLVVSIGLTDRTAPWTGRSGVTSPRTFPDSSWNDTLKAYEHGTRTIPGDTGTLNRNVGWREVGLSAQWWRPWFTVSARAGMRLIAARESRVPWGDVEATVPLSDRFAAVVVGGWQPVASATSDRSGRFLALGMRLLPRPLHHRPLPLGVSAREGSLSISEAMQGVRVVRLRASLARVVELSGDFTGWRPIALDAAEGGEWTTSLPLAPGTYKVAVRIDGGRWVAPPGTPRVTDDFGGESGIIVVR
jgi:hypothetical protein